MARKVGEPRRQYTSTMKTELYQSLQEYSFKSDIPISKIIDRAVEEYLRNMKTHS